MLTATKKRKNKKRSQSINIVPILDIVFILIFFLLTSSQFVKIFNVGSDLPIFTDKEEDLDKKQNLNLRVEVSRNEIRVFTGEPSALIKTLSLSGKIENELRDLNQLLVGLKKDHPEDTTCLLEPEDNVPQQLIVDVMDTIREQKVNKIQKLPLFNQLIFGNL